MLCDYSKGRTGGFQTIWNISHCNFVQRAKKKRKKKKTVMLGLSEINPYSLSNPVLHVS